jgi:hypothetical protein
MLLLCTADGDDVLDAPCVFEHVTNVLVFGCKRAAMEKYNNCPLELFNSSGCSATALLQLSSCSCCHYNGSGSRL